MRDTVGFIEAAVQSASGRRVGEITFRRLLDFHATMVVKVTNRYCGTSRVKADEIQNNDESISCSIAF